MFISMRDFQDIGLLIVQAREHAELFARPDPNELPPDASDMLNKLNRAVRIIDTVIKQQGKENNAEVTSGESSGGE